MASKALDKSGQSSTNGSGKTDWRDLVRTAADKVTGDTRPAAATQPSAATQPPAAAPLAAATPQRAAATPQNAAIPADAAAIARYDYLLKTAQPEQLEQVHRDAFARLTPAQREQVNAQLRAELPATEQPASAEPADLARAAARGEAHNPGFLRSLFAKPAAQGGAGALAGVGLGAVAGAGLGAAGGLLAAVAGGAVLSSVAAPILEQAAGLGVDFDSLAGGLGDLTAGAEDYASGLGDIATGAEDYAGGVGEQLTEAGSNFDASSLTDLASNFEIPGLGDLGRFFGRES
ncbi:cation-transporting ATPase [Cryobacterium sp. SO2]|uniref:cation-transporting ATPase n=1 Tax=Cryobacterium sp. SO2 TaxID=1897060 RepID=UPI00223D2AC2|nr:cation-transporting ATPase [Cryobacterium sp. SO2]WEO77326.1 cation-transporting ATPase [Cryobacterium sp. SO2]